MLSMFFRRYISIHAPQEERQFSCKIPNDGTLFQSTLLQEERRQKCTIILILICNNYCIVSIKSINTTIIISCKHKNIVFPGANHPLFHVRL